MLPEEQRKTGQVASWRHFAIVITIMILVAVQGVAVHARQTAPGASMNKSVFFVSLIAMEAALVYLVWRGIRPTGTTLSDLVGGRWQSPRDVIRDLGLALLLWLALVGIAIAWRQTSGSGGLSESVVAMLPRSPLERGIWIVLSIVAGAAEEIVFRGYCQRQFEALTGSRWIALILQALLFGVSHGYQGIEAMLRITVLGIAFGLMAIWRRSLRPGIIAHAWTDIASGLFYPG